MQTKATRYTQHMPASELEGRKKAIVLERRSSFTDKWQILSLHCKFQCMAERIN